jgi:hypothetical protein
LAWPTSHRCAISPDWVCVTWTLPVPTQPGLPADLDQGRYVEA